MIETQQWVEQSGNEAALCVTMDMAGMRLGRGHGQRDGQQDEQGDSDSEHDFVDSCNRLVGPDHHEKSTRWMIRDASPHGQTQLHVLDAEFGEPGSVCVSAWSLRETS